MLKKLHMIVMLVAISFAAVAQDWIEVNSGLANGNGVGQFSVGMNDSNAIWGAAIGSDGLFVEAFTRSTDGGQTWTAGTFNTGTGLSMMFAIDANTCWAIFNTGANQGLHKTTDGGITWVKKGGVYGASSFANVVHFFNDNDGFAQGDPIDGYYELYTTSDGGETWTRVPQANIPAPGSGEYGITGNYCSVGNSIWMGSNMGRVFYSSDKGMTWGATLTPFGAANVVQPLFKSETVGIAFRSYLNMGLEPTLNVTTDGGVTWSVLNVTGDMRARWFDYIPGTTSTWLGSSSEAGAEGISYSIDDGTNWNDLTVGVPVLAPKFIDNQTGWAGTWVVDNAGGILIYNGDPIGGGNFPVINVNPTSLDFALGYDEQETQPLNVSNVGNVDLNVNMSITYGEDAVAPVTTPVEDYVNVINPEQLSLAHTANQTPSPNVTDDMVIRYDNGINYDDIGVTYDGSFEVSAYWPAATMGQYAGMELTSVEIYIGDAPISCIMKIYGQGTTFAPGALLHQQTLSVNPVAWNNIVLSNPVPITGNDIWIGYEITSTAGMHSAGIDAGPAVVGFGDMYSVDGIYFESLSGFGLDYNWNIAATLSGDVQVEWLSINPMSGVVAPGNMLPFNVTADTEPFGGPTDETYYASIWIASNDPATPMLEVPVELVFPVGMRDLYSDAYVMMFPNPANNMVNLSTNYAMSNVKVVNQLGQVVLKQTPNSKTVSVNTAQLQAGIYFVKITSEAGESTQKLIIK